MRNARSQLRQLRRRPVPAWWRDAKLGIMVHWTPASVPAFAPVDAEIGELLASDRPDAFGSMPYTEWYENSLRFPDSPVARHHREVYGDRPYAEFARDWEAGPRLVGSRRLGPPVRGHRRAPRRVRGQALGRVLPVADRRAEPAPVGLALEA
jgi:hypothetical protein